ncbi:MAG: DUF3299 domain-containing protein [Pirellulales bacterium]|nr:DUF3299 domain-containing protein [Pirellulales bacterium]
MAGATAQICLLLALLIPCVAIRSLSGAESTAQATPASPPAEEKAPAARSETRNITFDTLKFEMSKDQLFDRKMLTKDIEKLAGSKIRIRGFILPGFESTDLENFILVRDNMECCFGPGAALYDCMIVDMIPGQKTNYTTRPVTVEGEFQVEEFKQPDGTILAIYHLTAEKVR